MRPSRVSDVCAEIGTSPPTRRCRTHYGLARWLKRDGFGTTRTAFVRSLYLTSVFVFILVCNVCRPRFARNNNGGISRYFNSTKSNRARVRRVYKIIHSTRLRPEPGCSLPVRCTRVYIYIYSYCYAVSFPPQYRPQLLFSSTTS